MEDRKNTDLLTYESDKIRYNYMKEGLMSSINTTIPSAIDVYNSEDLTMVKNHGDFIVYYEYFVKSCWDSLYDKTEYKGLKKKDALQKLVEERFARIASLLGCKILSWNFSNPVLEMKISNNFILSAKENQKKAMIQRNAEEKSYLASMTKDGNVFYGESAHDGMNTLREMIRAELNNLNGNETLTEKAVSKYQQRFMGQVHALQTGQLKPKDINPKYRKSIIKAAASIKPKEAEKFASTKTSGLPEKVTENKQNKNQKPKIKLTIKKSVGYISKEKVELFKKFIIFCLNYLGIDQPTNIFLTGERGGPITTTASYNPTTKETWVYAKDRNFLIDVSRSLAHELTHMKQDIDGKIEENSGQDGTDCENEANATAGVIMRKFGRLHPEIFK